MFIFRNFVNHSLTSCLVSGLFFTFPFRISGEIVKDTKMLPRVGLLLRNGYNAGRLSVRGAAGKAGAVEQAHGVTMNDLPVPAGCWHAAYAAKQRQYNMILIGSVAFFGVSLYCGIKSCALYLGLAPPRKDPCEENE